MIIALGRSSFLQPRFFPQIIVLCQDAHLICLSKLYPWFNSVFQRCPPGRPTQPGYSFLLYVPFHLFAAVAHKSWDQCHEQWFQAFPLSHIVQRKFQIRLQCMWADSLFEFVYLRKINCNISSVVGPGLSSTSPEGINIKYVYKTLKNSGTFHWEQKKKKIMAPGQ